MWRGFLSACAVFGVVAGGLTVPALTGVAVAACAGAGAVSCDRPADHHHTGPGAPTGLQAAGVDCGAGVLPIGTLTPTFSAIFPAAGRSGSVTGSFEWIEVPAAGLGTVTDTAPARQAAPPDKTSVTPGTRATSAAVTVAGDKTYAFRARSKATAPHPVASPWSAWCQFTVDTTVPPVTATVLTLPSGPGQTGRIRITSTATDVIKFQYGWDAATTVVAASTTIPKFADVDITARTFGENVLLLKAIDGALNEGNGSIEFTVARPSSAIARWRLEAYPGVSQTAALADGAPAPADSPLTAADLSWADDVRLQGGQTATFNGTSSAATTASAVVDTTGSFSVAAWVRLGALPSATDMKFATQDGTGGAGFEIGVRRSGSVPYWSFLMNDAGAPASTTVAALSPAAITAADVGRWTHVAGAYDVAGQKLSLYVDGVLVSQVDRAATPWSATGGFAVGRGFGGNFFTGSIADVRVFDRVLMPQDFTGRLASDPASGGFDEPGMLTPIQVGGWNFEGAVPCYVADLRDTCEAPDGGTGWGRLLALSRGADIATGRKSNSKGLWLDDRYFPADGGSDTTDEYARSAVKIGNTPPDSDGNEFAQWQDKPVLRTDQSFTVSVWAMLDSDAGAHAVVSQRGAHESSFSLKYRPDTGKWEFTLVAQDDATADVEGLQSGSDAEAGVWTHLTAVYDAARGQMRIYVNGSLDGVSGVGFTPFNSTGPLLVGRTYYHDAPADRWYGGIDDIAVYQGVMSDSAVAAMYAAG